MIKKTDFECKRCGLCCRSSVIKLTEEEIKNIKELGYSEDEFTREDILGSGQKVLKRIKNDCVFLELKDGKYFCKIHPVRPKICKDYPFFDSDEIEDCKPWPSFR